VVANTPSSGAALEPPSQGRQRVNLHSPALLVLACAVSQVRISTGEWPAMYRQSQLYCGRAVRRAKETKGWPEGGLRLPAY
jgi:hypothetical protein